MSGFTIDKSKEMNSMLRVATASPVPVSLQRESYSPPHNTSAGAQAVFVAALSPTYVGHDYNQFMGTLRATGYKGDIVVT